MKKKVKNIIMVFIKYVLVFIILIGMYLILLTVSGIIPSSALEKNVRESSETLNEEGERVFYNLGYKTESEEAFGVTVTKIGKVKITDLKNKVEISGDGDSATATEKPIIEIKKRTLNKKEITGLTDIYAVRYSVDDGFCGVTITGDKAIEAYLPDFKEPGAVKTGEVEMVAAVALKNSKSAGVLRNIKIV